jgi:large subunit ribosomal protein L9
MANAELLLLEPIEHLGNEGDTVSVASGYARNYLLPRGKAIPVTRANKKQIESLRTRAEKRRASELEAAEAIKSKLEGLSIVFAVKTGPGGKMFGAITAQDLIDRIGEEGVSLEKKKVSLYNPVKSLGKHTTRIRLHPEVAVDFDFEVVSENPIEEDNEEAATQEA